ncbi:MAG TPA: hypothetical protein VIK53_19605, partial [Verrucomicrobiae bacterium]
MTASNDHRAPDWFTPLRFGTLLALLIFAAFPQVILGVETFVARDYGFFAYPLAHFQRECFWHGEMPLWDPYNQCGVPFLAQWNTMPLYPPSLIYLTLPLTWSLSFFCLLHLWFAGMGMFFLARRWTGNNFAAAFAGTVFSFNGFTLGLLIWPSHIATFSWMPWVVLAVETAWREGGRKFFIAAIAGAFQMLAGGPEIIFLTWLILAALWLQQLIKNDSPRGSMLWRFPFVIALVIALSAAQLLPFLDLVAHAQREAGFADLRWSMPGRGWANFLVPMAFGTTGTEGIFFQHGQYWTSSYYLGLGALWLALVALVCLRERRVWLLGGIALAGLVFALGENTPVLPALQKIIPQLSFITYPVKYVCVVIFTVPLLAAFALARCFLLSSLKGGEDRGEEMKSLTDSIPSPRPSPGLDGESEKTSGLGSSQTVSLLPLGAVLLVLIAIIVLWTQHAPLPGDDPHAPLLNGFSRAAFLLLTGAVLFILTRASKTPLLRFAPLFLILVAWLDVFTHEPAQNPTVTPNVYQLNLARARLAMQPQPELGGSRAMLSPAAALELTRFAVSDPQNNFLAKRAGLCADANLLDAMPKVDGFFSLTPRHFDGLLSLIYSVTNGNWSRLEDFMGVSQITAPGKLLDWQARTSFLPLVTAGQKPVFLDDTNTLWAFGRNDFDASKIVFLPPEERDFVTVTNQTEAKILNAKFGNHTVDIEVDAQEPSLVVVAQTYYHNWEARLDNSDQWDPLLLRANVAFQAVQVPAGKHAIHLFYQDRAFEIGAAVSSIGWIASLSALLILR